MSLIRLAHAGRPKTFMFTSSVSTCMGIGHPSPTVPETPIGDDPSVSLCTGYALSKYIGKPFPAQAMVQTNTSLVERITQEANKILGLDIKLLRVGQICGSTLTGNWNTSEMWPIMFATSAHPKINAIPLFPGKMVDWIPVDVAAATITDILLCQENGYSVHNIVNSHLIEWKELVEMLQSSALKTEEAKMEEVDMKEWVHRLKILASDAGVSPTTIPGLKLLHFFENMCNELEGHVVSKVFETEKTRGVSSALRDCVAMRREWIEMNVKKWRERCFVV
jgi:thioester reductase-like protein